VDPSRFISRWSWISADVYTTTTFPTHFQIPVSINSGTSTTHTFSPLIQAPTTAQTIAFLTAGCTIPFNRFLFLSSLNITAPSFFLSRHPSGWSISSPKALTMAV